MQIGAQAPAWLYSASWGHAEMLGDTLAGPQLRTSDLRGLRTDVYWGCSILIQKSRAFWHDERHEPVPRRRQRR